MTTLEALNEGKAIGKMSALNELMLKILTHGYSVDNIKSEIDTMRDELKEMTPEKYEAEAKADSKDKL